jgi:hypothetical protein
MGPAGSPRLNARATGGHLRPREWQRSVIWANLRTCQFPQQHCVDIISNDVPLRVKSLARVWRV